MRVKFQQLLVLTGLLVCFIPFSFGKPITYVIDPDHTFPTFEADHMGGLSLWRGRINSTTGEIILDKKNKTGFVKVIMNMNSLDFGHDGMNKHAKSGDMFDVEKFPESVYEGTLVNFQDGAPTKVEGELTLHGITKKVDLEIKAFKCKLYPRPPIFKLKRVCGADAHGNLMRDEFGISYAKMLGFKMDVALRIGIEAIKK